MPDHIEIEDFVSYIIENLQKFCGSKEEKHDESELEGTVPQ